MAKKYYIIILLITLLFSSCGERKVILTEDELPKDIFYLTDEIKPFTGKCLIYYTESDNLKEEISFKDGILNGEHRSFYPSGQLKRIGNYSEGYYNGTWISFDEKGNKLYEVEYKNDTLIGYFYSWYKTGIIKEKGNYMNNSRIGRWYSYDEAGMITKKEEL